MNDTISTLLRSTSLPRLGDLGRLLEDSVLPPLEGGAEPRGELVLRF